MASEKQLISVMASRQKLWSPGELCGALNIHVCELVRLVRRAREAGEPVHHESSELTGYSSKFWLAEA